MRLFILFFVFIAFNACSQQSEPINYGKDACHTCKMTIIDKKFGAEIVTRKGKIYKFDDLVCLVSFIKTNAISNEEINNKLIIDYQKENNFLNAEQSVYFVSDDLHSPMNGNAAAFSEKAEAQKFQNGKKGIIMDWNEIFNKYK